MLPTLGFRIRIGLTRLVVKTKRLLHELIRPLPVVVGLMRDLTRSRDQLIAENALLRQQLIVASRKVKRPVFKPHEPGLMVLLSRIVRGWRDAVLLVKPETILRWHREGFRLFWKLKSRKRKPAESKISAEQIALIRQMAQENRLWGAERIRGELLKLRISVAKRTIQRYMRGVRPPTLPHGQSWKTFLANHTVWALERGAISLRPESGRLRSVHSTKATRRPGYRHRDTRRSRSWEVSRTNCIGPRSHLLGP